MHPYIPHLLSDIAAAHQEVPCEDIHDHAHIILSDEQLFEEVERYVFGGEPIHTFGYYCGLQSLDFPPAEQLENDDLQKVCIAFKQMMETWNLSIDLPDNLPSPIAYSLTVGMLNTKTDIPKMGLRVFDFCTGYAPDCDLGSYCPCLKFWNDDEQYPPFDINEDEMESKTKDHDYLDEDELPF